MTIIIVQEIGICNIMNQTKSTYLFLREKARRVFERSILEKKKKNKIVI